MQTHDDDVDKEIGYDSDSALDMDLEGDELGEVESDSSSLSIPNESIDFNLVYALHSFPADVDGQANVTKGDSLFLIDSSNSYWWLVRVLKTQEVGYIPAENIETPLERLARLNKHRNVDLTSATHDELQSDLSISAAHVRDILRRSESPSPLIPGKSVNTVRNPLDSSQSLAFSCSLQVHRYPPAVWALDEWLIEREEWRAATITDSSDYEYDLLAFDDDQDHEEGEWDVGNYEAEDQELAAEKKAMMTKSAQNPHQPAPVSQSILVPQADAPAMGKDTHKERRDRESAQTLKTVESPKVPSSAAVSPDIRVMLVDGDSEYHAREQAPIPMEGSTSTGAEIVTPTVVVSAPSTQTLTASSSPAAGKLRKDRNSASDDDRDAKKKKGNSVFGLFSRRNAKEKGKSSSSSESEVGGRFSDDSSVRQSTSSSGSVDTPLAAKPRPQQQPSSLRNQATSLQASTTSQPLQREEEHTLQSLRPSSLKAQVQQPNIIANVGSSPPTSLLSSLVTPRSRPGSLVLVQSTGDGTGVPELSVIRVFAGPTLQVETIATFKTALINLSTTSEELIKQAVNRFRLDHVDPQDYQLTVKRVDGTTTVLGADERPLIVFEGLVDGRINKRSSIGSIGSLTSILSSDFTDDSAGKFYLDRKIPDEPVVNAHASVPPDTHFALQLTIYSTDLPDGMIFDPLTEAIIYKNPLNLIGSSNTSARHVSQTKKRNIFTFPVNSTVTDVIESSLERLGIESGVVDGGDEVEDKISQKKGLLHVRYRLNIDDGNGKERELGPSSRIIDALPQPVPRTNAGGLESSQILTPADPMFILRRATSYRISTASRHSISGALDEIALAKLYRNSVASTTSATSVESAPPNLASMGMSRQELIVAQRKMTRANQQAILSTSTQSAHGPGPEISERQQPLKSLERESDRNTSPLLETPLTDRHAPPQLSTIASLPPQTPAVKLFLPRDDFGLSHMMSIIELRASQSHPRQVHGKQHPIEEMIFGRELDLSSLHPRIRSGYANSFKLFEETDLTFVDVLRDELRKNRELQENVKQLQGDVDKLQDSETMKRARAAYERARLTSSIKENPRLRAAAEELKKTGVKVGDAVSEALKTMEESELMRAISKASAAVSASIEKSTEPIRNTAAYKALSETLVDALDDSGSAKHAGFEEREARRLRRQRRLAKAGIARGPSAKVMANPEAGSAVVLHKDSPRQEKWNRLKETNPIFKTIASMRQAFDESENPVVVSMRSVTDTVGSWFEENETAQVMRLMKNMDPHFTRENFDRELREYIVPEVVDAYLSADQASLKAWCGEATYNVLWATMEQYLKHGLISDSKVLDIRQVDVSAGKILDNEIPVFVISFSTQEILLFRNAVSGEIVDGAEDKVEQCIYVAAVTRIEEELDNELTGGWKVIEMARRSARAYL
ncbi:Mitochondrial import inner membrane translocase subunit TIM44 [Mycena indigotica]|uniref:Mitochondrial import inner membrane translocase subunit TIM44 n=1 Tax=Mycena indigotica TaxID=2126181 RepID=A0A8H6T8G4_9AGAR|nr:Mitochondrial import inner membrane translocase subunit TIM44 [Mycena indigotica]KAF7312146.1 Mitochondrial import inner membrane translocase subunit TIM44 [Mycena indigotica]